LSSVICLLRGLVLGCCVFLFVVLLNLCFHLLFNIIGSSPTWFVSEKKKVLQETPFGGVKPSPGSTNQRTQQVAINKATETCATMQNGRMAQVLSGRPKAKESSWTTREEQVLHSHTEKTPSLRVKYSEHGTGLHALNWIMIVAPSYITLSA